MDTSGPLQSDTHGGGFHSPQRNKEMWIERRGENGIMRYLLGDEKQIDNEKSYAKY